jgi:hypothetical protein
MDQPLQKGTCGQNDSLRCHDDAAGKYHTIYFGSDSMEGSDAIFENAEVGNLLKKILNCGPVQFTISLGPGAPNGGALLSVEHAKLNPATVRSATHDPIKGVNLSNEVSFPQSTNGWVAGHHPDRVSFVGDEQRIRAHASCSRSRFGPSVPATHDDYIIMRCHRKPLGFVSRESLPDTEIGEYFSKKRFGVDSTR